MTAIEFVRLMLNAVERSTDWLSCCFRAGELKYLGIVVLGFAAPTLSESREVYASFCKFCAHLRVTSLSTAPLFICWSSRTEAVLEFRYSVDSSFGSSRNAA